MTPWYRRSKCIVLFLILLFPVGLFMLWKFSTWPKDIKVCICLMAALMAGTGWYVLNMPQTESSVQSTHQQVCVAFTHIA